MPFEKGRQKTGGIQKGSKHSTFKTELEELGLFIPTEINRIWEESKRYKDYQAQIDIIKMIMPYCLKKMPTDHNVQASGSLLVDYKAILKQNGIKTRES